MLTPFGQPVVRWARAAQTSISPAMDNPQSERPEHSPWGDTAGAAGAAGTAATAATVEAAAPAPAAQSSEPIYNANDQRFPKLIPWFAPKYTIAQAAMPYPDNPAHLTRLLAGRLRARRLELGLPREELAERSGLATAAIKAFERTGRISLERFLTLTLALGRYDELVYLFERRAPDSPHVGLRRMDRRTRGRRFRPRDRVGTATEPPPR